MADGPDKGRAWLVAVAAMTINMVSAGIFRSQGLIFVQFMKDYKISREDAAIPFSVRSSMRNICAPAVGILGQKYGIPTVTLVGGILGTLSAAMCFFANDITLITVIWGGLNGFSMALLTVLPQVVIGQYFVKYRTTASGLSYSGGCMGSFVFPALFEFLLYLYGLNGTFLILAGMFLHSIPAAMLLTKPSWKIELDNNSKHKHTNCRSSSDCKTLSNGISGVKSNDKIHDASTKVTFEVGDEYDPEVPSSDIANPFSGVNDFTHTEPNAANQMSNSTQQTTLNNKYVSANSMPSAQTISNFNLSANKLLQSSTETFFDIDLDYIKQMSDLVYQMFAMDVPNMEVSYRAILLEVEQDDLWHPEKQEIIQEIENMYVNMEKSLEINQISDTTINANGLYIKRTILNRPLTASKKSQSLRAVRKYFKSYKRMALDLGKNRSAPNMSNVYNELVRKDYILTKMKVLATSNEIRIISHLSMYNPRDVLRVLFQVRSLYKLYIDLESSEHNDTLDNCESTSDCTVLCAEDDDKETDATRDVDDEASKARNTFKSHIISALKLHTNPMFLLICCSRAAYFITFNPVMTTIVDFAMDKGCLQEDGKFIIAAMSLGDLVGRITLGWITDRGVVSLPRYMNIVPILLGGCCVGIPMLYTKWMLFTSISLFAMLQGSLFIRHPVLVTKYMHADEQSIAVGCMEFSSGILGLLVPLYIGYFRDNIGSYNPIFYINGIISALAGLAWLSEPYITNKNVN